MVHDFLVIGNGIAGCVLSNRLRDEGFQVCLASDQQAGSSEAAAGLINPVVVKRFNIVWKAAEMLNVARAFYHRLENQLDRSFFQEVDILRRLNSADEAKTWTSKAQSTDLECYLDQEILQRTFNGINAPHGYGPVTGGARLDVATFLNNTNESFKQTDSFIAANFRHSDLRKENHLWCWQALRFKNIVFCEGARIQMNPLFAYLPIQGNKGESLIIRIPDFHLDAVIKGAVFLCQAYDDLFWVGATYDRNFADARPSKSGLDQLTERLERFLKHDYEVVEHLAGIRPTVPDRRPIIGQHPEHDTLHVFNGMGSRAALIAPWAAEQFIAYLQGESLVPDIDVKRFEKRWKRSSNADMT